MFTARHGAVQLTTMTSSRLRRPIGTCLPSTGPQSLRPTTQRQTSNRSASSPHETTGHPWPWRPHQVSSRGERAMDTWASSLFPLLRLANQSLMRYTSPANLAEISGRETVATQHKSPNLHWRAFVSSSGDDSSRPARDSRDVGRISRFPARFPASTSQRNLPPGPIPGSNAQRPSPEPSVNQTAFLKSAVPLAANRVHRNPEYHQCAWR